jgi:hypothetical protein
MATLTTEREARIAAGLTPEPTTTEREDNALGFARMRRIVARFDGRCAGCRAGFAAGDQEGRHADLFHNWSSGDPDTIKTPEFWREDWARVGIRIVHWEPAEAPVPADYRMSPEHGRGYLVVWEVLDGH